MPEFSERELRDWLEQHISELVDSIENVKSVRDSIESRLRTFRESQYVGRQLIEASMHAALDEI